MSEKDRIIIVKGKEYNISKLKDDELIILQKAMIKYGNSLVKEIENSKKEEVNYGEY